MFITLEGIEGCGKTTRARLLAGHLREAGRASVVVTREPGGTALTGRIRELLADPQAQLDPRAELLLFLADRAQHVASVVRPAIERGDVVVCDRYCDSTTAYQGYGRGHDLQWIARLNDWASLKVLPQLTLWIDCEIRLGLERAARETGCPGDRFEAESLAFHERVHRGFAAIHQENAERVVRIDGNGSIEEIRQAICAVVDSRLRDQENHEG